MKVEILNYIAVIKPYILSGLAGAIASLIITKYYEFATRPRLDVIEDETTPDKGVNPDRCSYHVKVKNTKGYWPFRVRKPAWNTKATIQILDENMNLVINEVINARWPSAPEPISTTIYNGKVVSILDSTKLFVGRNTTIYYHEPQRLDIGMKFDQEDDFYVFSNESYLYKDWKNPEWRLGLGKYYVIVKVYYEYGVKEVKFLLINRDKDKKGIAIKKLKK